MTELEKALDLKEKVSHLLSNVPLSPLDHVVRRSWGHFGGFGVTDAFLILKGSSRQEDFDGLTFHARFF